jgi:MoxR-like ATPase
MSQYPFHLIPPEAPETPSPESREWLTRRPFLGKKRSLEEDARHFVAGEPLAEAINTAIAIGDPLLLTGEPGTGKTQAAYYTAWLLGVKCIHFQVKSDASARDLLYDFDMVRYFRDAHLEKEGKSCGKELDKADYLEERALGKAFRLARETKLPQVLLIDEIDKAPRDFPNDLLHELDQMEFTIKETGGEIKVTPELRPIVFITSNSERRLPEPFLRRCVYHHIEFDEGILWKAVQARKTDFEQLSDEFLELAVQRFQALRDRAIRKPPATAELLAWLRVLSLAAGGGPVELPEDLNQLPYLQTLVKDHQDRKELGVGR